MTRGDYWQKRDAESLAREVGEWNHLIAREFGKLRDQFGDGVQSAVAQFPNFEHLEAAGQAQAETHEDHSRHPLHAAGVQRRLRLRRAGRDAELLKWSVVASGGRPAYQKDNDLFELYFWDYRLDFYDASLIGACKRPSRRHSRQ